MADDDRGTYEDIFDMLACAALERHGERFWRPPEPRRVVMVASLEEWLEFAI